MLLKPNYYLLHINCIVDNTISFIQLSIKIKQLIWFSRKCFKICVPDFTLNPTCVLQLGQGKHNFVNCSFLIESIGLRLYTIHILKSSMYLRYCRLWDERLSKPSLFVGLPLFQFSIGYIKKLILRKTASFLILFLYFVLKLGELSVHLAKYDAMSKAK